MADFLAKAISIHALREEGDPYRWFDRSIRQGFLSTPSARRATSAPTVASVSVSDFYPRPPRGGRPPPITCSCLLNLFLSTPSARRATMGNVIIAEASPISIHALREEGDAVAGQAVTNGHDFYPRPPRGGRPPFRRQSGLHSRFLSTPSARRATCAHVPLPTLRSNFYPRPPRGGRRSSAVSRGLSGRFLSTPSARRATRLCRRRRNPGDISIHALREEGDERARFRSSSSAKFLSTPSARRATVVGLFL